MSNNEIKIDFKIKRKHLTIALIAIVATSLIIPYQIFAQSQIRDTVSSADTFDAAEPSHVPAGTCVAWASNEIQDKSSWYAIMCTASVSNTVDKVLIAFVTPAGYIVTGTGIEPIQQKGLGPCDLSASGITLTCDLHTPKSIAAGTTFKIIVGHIINPSPGVPANYQVIVQTRTSSNVIIQTFPATAPVPLELIDSTEILNGSITGADVSTSFLRPFILADTAAGNALGWNPDGVATLFLITTSGITASTIVHSDVDDPGVAQCGTNDTFSTGFFVKCTPAPLNGARLLVTVWNTPATTITGQSEPSEQPSEEKLKQTQP